MAKSIFPSTVANVMTCRLRRKTLCGDPCLMGIASLCQPVGKSILTLNKCHCIQYYRRKIFVFGKTFFILLPDQFGKHILSSPYFVPIMGRVATNASKYKLPPCCYQVRFTQSWIKCPSHYFGRSNGIAILYTQLIKQHNMHEVQGNRQTAHNTIKFRGISRTAAAKLAEATSIALRISLPRVAPTKFLI